MKVLNPLLMSVLLFSLIVKDVSGQQIRPDNSPPVPEVPNENRAPSFEPPESSPPPSFVSPELAEVLLRVNDQTDPIRKLRIEKLRLIQKEFEHLKRRWEIQGGTIDALMEAETRGQREMLLLANNNRQKIAILKSLLKTLQQIEKQLQLRHNAINGVLEVEPNSPKINKTPRQQTSTSYVNYQPQFGPRFQEDTLLGLLQIKQAILEVKIELLKFDKPETPSR